MTELGHITKTHGRAGELAVHLSRPWPQGLDWVWVEIDGIPVPWHVEGVRQRGAEGILITLRGINTLDKAATLAGKGLLTDLSEKDFPADGPDAYDDGEDASDGLYLSDLVGYTLKEVDGTTIGRISDWDDSTANVLLHVDVDDGGRSVMVPLADDLVTDLDRDERTITLDLPTGLINS